MERVTIEKAKRLFGNNFVGLEELRPLFEKMRLSYVSVQVPIIQYSYDVFTTDYYSIFYR